MTGDGERRQRQDTETGDANKRKLERETGDRRRGKETEKNGDWRVRQETETGDGDWRRSWRRRLETKTGEGDRRIRQKKETGDGDYNKNTYFFMRTFFNNIQALKSFGDIAIWTISSSLTYSNCGGKRLTFACCFFLHWNLSREWIISSFSSSLELLFWRKSGNVDVTKSLV